MLDQIFGPIIHEEQFALVSKSMQ